MPCHGNSQHILPASSQEFEKTIIDCILPHIHKPFILVGYSMGGRIALKLSNFFKPEMLVLISTNMENLSKIEKEKRAKLDEKLQSELDEKSFSNFLENWYSQPLFQTLKNNSRLYQAMIQHRLKEDPGALKAAHHLLSPARYSFDQSSFEKINIPLLYAAGYHDQKCMQHAQKLREQKPEAWLAYFSKASHALHLEDPENFSLIFQQFYRYFYGNMDREEKI